MFLLPSTLALSFLLSLSLSLALTLSRALSLPFVRLLPLSLPLSLPLPFSLSLPLPSTPFDYSFFFQHSLYRTDSLVNVQKWNSSRAFGGADFDVDGFYQCCRKRDAYLGPFYGLFLFFGPVRFSFDSFLFSFRSCPDDLIIAALVILFKHLGYD
ncbi:hypothetical protein LY76DRAFT_598215 [Colletotrichum caudatum]|nr:hypothetical protein LY76DRAFT_598215 [Colletotrichum caudatum]